MENIETAAKEVVVVGQAAGAGESGFQIQGRSPRNAGVLRHATQYRARASHRDPGFGSIIDFWEWLRVTSRIIAFDTTHHHGEYSEF